MTALSARPSPTARTVHRLGYFADARDAAIARKVRPNMSLQDMFVVGPQVHALKGIVQVELVRMDIDVDLGKHYGEFIWNGSTEDEQHVRHFGIGVEPVCWMQIGYASGFTTEFMGRPVLYREVECRSMGQPHCRIVGKPVNEWDDAADDLRFLQAEPFTKGLSALAGQRQTEARGIASRAPATAFDDDMVGASPGFSSVCYMVRRVAETRATVLFLGESGVGKEVFARTLHRVSPRAAQPFVALNCAAIQEALVESELFGVEKGAYAGAMSRPHGPIRARQSRHGVPRRDRHPQHERRASCSVRCRKAKSNASATTVCARSMYESSPRPTSTCAKR